jgi:hypothetical protein
MHAAAHALSRVHAAPLAIGAPRISSRFANSRVGDGNRTCVGVDASVFGLREKGCEKDNSCFITKEMCAKSTKSIDHSIALVGFGTDPTHGDYWIVKVGVAGHMAPHMIRLCMYGGRGAGGVGAH